MQTLLYGIFPTTTEDAMWIEQAFRISSWIMGGAAIWFLLGAMLSNPVDLLTTPKESAKRAGIFFLLFAGSQVLLRFGLFAMLFMIATLLCSYYDYQILVEMRTKGRCNPHTLMNALTTGGFAVMFALFAYSELN